MSLFDKISIHICETECYKCHKKYKAAYVKYVLDNHINIYIPDNVPDKMDKIFKENGVIIEKIGYKFGSRVEVYTVNICPHCHAPYGKSHLKELVGKEIKEIVLVPENSNS